MKVVQFGAGCIGRGFLSPLYRLSDYEIVYVDIDEALVERLNEQGRYCLELVDADGSVERRAIDGFRALRADDIRTVAQELSDADLAAVSVGADKMLETAASIAAGIQERANRAPRPLNILLCENLGSPGAIMRRRLNDLLDPDTIAFANTYLGLIDMVVGRMVPKPSSKSLAEDPLRIVAEPHGELLAAGDSFKGEIPRLAGMETVAPIDAYFKRKLFILNNAHAALAYLGYPKYEYIWECLSDGRIRETAEAAICEASEALIAQFGLDRQETETFRKDILRRLANKALGDTVERVAAGPLRKLMPGERLVGAADLCVCHGIAPVALARAINAALAYDNPSDPSARQMRKQIGRLGRRRFLEEHCRIAAYTTLADLLEEQDCTGQ